MAQEYSVLMSVYEKELPEHLLAAVESMIVQSAPACELVLVCDGLLTADLEGVIAQLQKNYSDRIKPIRLPENIGLSGALNAGLKHCSCDIVARMDSDDISLPDRCERQLAALQEHSCDIVSGTVLEFEEDPDAITARRVLPSTDEEIRIYARSRNPFNHPAVMFRKAAVLEEGGYGECALFEDYQLWLRLLASGKKGHNITEPVLKMRSGSDMYARRGGWQYFKCVRKFLKFRHEIGFSSRANYILSIISRGTVALMPNFMRVRVYKRFLRQQ